MTGVIVKYNDQVIKNQAIDGNFSLKTANKYLTDDITITTDSYVNNLDVNYGDTTLIDSVSGNHTYKLRCKDTIMSDDLNFSCQVTEYVSYITFSSPEPFTLAIANATKNWNGTLEYSTNRSTWTMWDGTTTLSSSGNKLYLRGTGNTKMTEGTNTQWVLTGSNISCTGNIENLLDYQTVARGEHPMMAVWCYSYMFNNCTSLTSTPALPATTLTYACYYSMFRGCTSLTTAPALPATTLAGICYYHMFNGCTSLTTAPALPATTLADYCYSEMFRGCTKIKLSTTQTGDYQTPYRIPSSGTGTAGTKSLYLMLYNTGGSFTDDPSIDTVYYTSNTVVPAT